VPVFLPFLQVLELDISPSQEFGATGGL